MVDGLSSMDISLKTAIWLMRHALLILEKPKVKLVHNTKNVNQLLEFMIHSLSEELTVNQVNKK